MDRREFIRTSALASAALAAGPLQHCAMPSRNDKATPIGLQVYTLREQLQANLEDTLRQVAAIGYEYIELFGYREGTYLKRPIQEVGKLLADIGLKVHSSHTLTGAHEPDVRGTLVNNWESAVADAKTLGQSYMVCAYLMDSERQSIDDYKRLAELFNKSGEVCKQYGIQFAYHNHDFEFFTLNDQIPFDVLLAETDPALVQFELDIYWINKAGFSHLDYFKKHPGRFPLWHVKDMDATPEKAFAEVGSGVINWKEAFAAANTAGMQYFFVEQDVCKRPPMESVAMSYQYLRSIL